MSTDPSVPRSTRLAGGAAAGAGAYLLGLLATFVLAGGAAARLTVTGRFAGPGPEWRRLLWLFYDAHLVGVRTPRGYGPDGEFLGGGELFRPVDLLDVEFLYLVPILALVAAGYLLARRVGAGDPQAGVTAGVAVALGYLPVVVLGLALATQSGVAPDAIRAVVVAGVVYPVALGALGGAVAGLRARSRADAGAVDAESGPGAA